MENFKKLLFLLNPSERKQAVLLLFMTIIMALLDTIGVASILPFIAVLSNPNLIETNLILNTIFQTSKIIGVENNQDFLFILGIFTFVLFITSILFKAIITYVQVHFIQMREYSIGKRLVEGYLHQPYSWFLSHHSADLGKTILSEVQQIVGGGLGTLITLITQTLVVITLIILLLIVDPKLSLIVGISLALIYGFIFSLIRKFLDRIGRDRLKCNQLRFIAVTEAFEATKEIKYRGLEETYVKLFSNSAQIYARTQAYSQIIRQFPRFILEGIAFGGILLILLHLLADKGSFSSAIPIVSLYILAGYRLMPALQQIYGCFAQLTFIGPSLRKLYEDLNNLKPFNQNQDRGVLSLKKAIVLKNIDYNYPNTAKAALRNISMNIPVKSTVGLVGVTGSGKTTVVDIILGLLEVQKGILEVDGTVITKKNVRSWQRSIGYVPQHIFLTDNSFAANIAFGVDYEDINQEAVIKASKIANLHSFINDLPEQYQTKIGERGARLSGGQCQRIGIARALYHNPEVLILDEATSALDNQTEQVVMEAINNLGKSVTTILIAHRLDTLKNCNIIFKFDNGQLISQGPFKKLFNNKDNN